MADNPLTIADVMLRNSMDLDDIEVSQLLQDAPLFGILPGDESSNGNVHKYTRETGAPVVGFRAENVGRDHSKSADELVTVTLKFLDASNTVDVQVAEVAPGGPEAEINRESMRHLRAAMKLAEQQYIYGTDQEAAGFTGLVQAIGTTDAEKITKHTGLFAEDLTSIWLIRATDADVKAIAKGGLDIHDSQLQQVQDATGKRYSAYVTAVHAWLGIQIGSKYSAHRIANVATNKTAAASKRASDDLILAAVDEMPYTPTHVLMHRYAVRDLRLSRDNFNGALGPNNRATDVDGLPIVRMTSLKTDEALVA